MAQRRASPVPRGPGAPPGHGRPGASQAAEKPRTPRVVFQPAVYRGFQKGVNQIVNVIRPTLGPGLRPVLLERLGLPKPEFLDDGGLIARRIIQLPKRGEDVGAMFVRQMLWDLHEEVGDGAATAAVLFQSIYNQGVHYVVSGGDAMVMRRYLEKAMRSVLDELGGMAYHVDGKERLAQIANSVCNDPPLAKYLGEIFEIIGEYGQLEIRGSRGRGLEREYVEGMYWESGLASRKMMADPVRLRTDMENAAVLISDLDIEDPRDLLPLVQATFQSGVHSLLVVARRFSDNAIAMLLNASRDPAKFQAIAARTPTVTSDEQATVMADLAALTGGLPFLRVTSDTLKRVKPQDLGHARRVWADANNFGIVGGKGDPRALRKHIANLRSAFGIADDPDMRKKLLKRIGRLLGGSAALWVGGVTETEIGARKELAERTSDAVRGALREGVVIGGGVALLACRPALQRMFEASTEADERAVYRILIRALEEPIRTLITNAGYDASEIMAEIKQAPPSYGFDVTSGRVVGMAEAGIFDVAAVQKSAVFSAISSAALALTVDVVIHRKKPPEALQT